MYNHLASSNKKKRRLLRSVEKHQVKLREHSKFVTGKRLSSKHSGIFSRGQISGTVLRDSIFKEDIKARAEANLTKILQLARGESSKTKNLYDEGYEDADLARRADTMQLPDPIAIEEFKQLKQTTIFDSVNVTSRLSSQEDIEKLLGVSSDIPKSSSICIPYSEFAMKMKFYLNEAKDTLNNKYNIDLVGELTELLQDTIKNRRLQLTPPSGGKGISHYLNDAASKKELDDNDVVIRQREVETLFNSSSSSGISPNFDSTAFSTSKFSSPLGVIQHYERNLVKHSCAGKKSLKRSNQETKPGQLGNGEVAGNGSQKTITWLGSKYIEIAKLLTPAVVTSNLIQIPKTVVIDPIQYLERYEKSTELNIVNNKKGKENIFPQIAVNSTNANISDGDSHQHIPLNTLVQDKHMYNINEYINCDSLNKKENLFENNKFDSGTQSMNSNIVSKSYPEPFPKPYQQQHALHTQYFKDNMVSNNYSTIFPATGQVMLKDDRQLQTGNRQLQEPFQQIHRPHITDSALYRSRHQRISKELMHNKHRSFSQIVNSRDLASPNLFSPATSLSQSQYMSQGLQMSQTKPSYQHVNSRHLSSYHLSNGFNNSQNLIKPTIVEVSDVHLFQNQTKCLPLPNNFHCGNNLSQEPTFVDNAGVACDGAFVTCQKHGRLQDSFVPSHSDTHSFSTDLLNYSGDHNLNGENLTDVPSSSSVFFCDLIDFCS